MPNVRYDPAKKELRVRLEGLTEDRAKQFFLRLGEFLRSQSEHGFACVGHKVVEAVGGAGASAGCTFCEIGRRTGAARQDGTSCVV